MNSKQVAFTICAKNYIGLAQILEESIRVNNPNIEFYIFVADEIPQEEIEQLLSNVIITRNNLSLEPLEWERMSFWYDLTSFCTAIKPYCFKWLIENTECENIIYFDPDIYVFNSLEFIYDKLQDYSIVLTPHVLQMESEFTGSVLEKHLLFSGIYNLGFIALKVNEVTKHFINWWGKRLVECCTADALDSFFYDQRWIDFLPAYLGNDVVYISRNLGMNVAPWNFHERKISEIEGAFYVTNRISGEKKSDKLLFVHYSGFNYSFFKSGKFYHKSIKNIPMYPDIQVIFDYYSLKLQQSSENFEKYINWNYSYNFYDNGKPIDKFHRRIFYKLFLKNANFQDPFSSQGSFYKLLKSHKMISTRNSSEIEKITHHELSQYKGKLLYFNYITKFIFLFLGYNRYLMLLKLLRHYSRPEVQIHLLDREYMDNNI